ncbi:hypothetical protein ACFSQ7_39075 [Paenibacillus rhizoplanae]
MENEAAGARNRYTGARAERKGRYYRSNLIIVLIVSSIPGLIIGLLVYFMAGGVWKRSCSGCITGRLSSGRTTLMSNCPIWS